MNKALSASALQRLDKLAIERYKIPSLALMENAGAACAGAGQKLLGRRQKVCVICGCGNNGGDGFVAARHLVNAGKDVTIYLLGPVASLKPDAAIHFRLLKRLRYRMRVVAKLSSQLKADLASSDVLIDALFGVGLNRQIGEPYRTVIEAINRSGRRVLSVDVPSGLDATSGKILGSCVKARTTVTFTALKSGFLTAEGKRMAGRVIVADIGIPRQLLGR